VFEADFIDISAPEDGQLRRRRWRIRDWNRRRRPRAMGRLQRRNKLADVNAAAAAELEPAIALEFSMTGANSIGMKAKAARDFAGAGKALT
jgi:hypothetical protein